MNQPAEEWAMGIIESAVPLPITFPETGRYMILIGSQLVREVDAQKGDVLELTAAEAASKDSLQIAWREVTQ